MIFLYILIGIVLAFFVFFLFAIKPNKGRREELKPFCDTFIAHRGFFDNNTVAENSLPAFAMAVERNYAIELDVQLTKDNVLIVFHDKTLKRMCGDKRALRKMTYAELSQFSLLHTNQKIPLFKDVLKLVGGRVPLVVEIKPEGRFIKTAELTNELLLNYNGLYCVESFHPLILKWFKENNPQVIRGQLSTVYTSRILKKPWWIRFMLNNLMLNFIAKPDFIAYNHKHKNRLTYILCRKLYKPVSAAWTLRNQKELNAAKDVFEMFIFDSFSPR